MSALRSALADQINETWAFASAYGSVRPEDITDVEFYWDDGNGQHFDGYAPSYPTLELVVTATLGNEDHRNEDHRIVVSAAVVLTALLRQELGL